MSYQLLNPFQAEVAQISTQFERLIPLMIEQINREPNINRVIHGEPIRNNGNSIIGHITVTITNSKFAISNTKIQTSTEPHNQATGPDAIPDGDRFLIDGTDKYRISIRIKQFETQAMEGFYEGSFSSTVVLNSANLTAEDIGYAIKRQQIQNVGWDNAEAVLVTKDMLARAIPKLAAFVPSAANLALMSVNTKRLANLV